MNKSLFIVIGCFVCIGSLCSQTNDSSEFKEVSCERVELGCLILGSKIEGEHIIKDSVKYQELISIKSPHSNCANYQLPIIDFSKYTLIGYVSAVGGCEKPEISHNVLDLNGNYLVNITIVQKGQCLRNNSISIWCLIPVKTANTSIKFNIETK